MTVCREDAIRQAHLAEKEVKSKSAVGSLHGIPISIKDLFETEGVKTACGSRLMAQYVPNVDCTVVKRLKQAGAILLGKTNTHEFALGGITPPTKNPWNLEHIPGGSSGGSAAAVAISSAIAATGSDTGGSIRIPASYCGIVGFKPTYGLVSRAGVFPESWSLDHVGPMTKRVEDAAFMLAAMAGYDPSDPASSHALIPQYHNFLHANLERTRIGIPRNYFFDGCDEQVSKLVLNAIEKLESLGCKRVEFEFPYLDEIMAAYTTIVLAEASSVHEMNLRKATNEFREDSRLFLEEGLFIPATYYIQAQRIRAMVFPKISQLFRDFDAIITPTQPMVAPESNSQPSIKDAAKLGEIDFAMVRYLAPFNLTGLPALTVPCGFSEGLPVGLQIVGRVFDETTVLCIGYAYQQATDWHLRFPELRN